MRLIKASQDVPTVFSFQQYCRISKKITFNARKSNCRWSNLYHCRGRIYYERVMRCILGWCSRYSERLDKVRELRDDKQKLINELQTKYRNHTGMHWMHQADLHDRHIFIEDNSQQCDWLLHWCFSISQEQNSSCISTVSDKPFVNEIQITRAIWVGAEDG